MGKVTIKELRGIKCLEFEIPSKGVYLLTGCNGCGKTSLFVTLNRICNNTAFSGFKLGRTVGMDKFTNTRIIYSDGVNTISYKRTNRGWEPNPPKSKPSSIIPFSDCCFITTTGFRFYEPSPDLFYKRRARVVYSDPPEQIIDGLNKVFNTRKFDNLKFVTIKSKHGRQKQLHRENILYVIKNGNDVYSEMNFSLGERIVLNTLDFAQGIKDNSLLLVDEIELALHPIAQIRFYEYLKKLTDQKQLTCIISTHSSTLIKESDNIIYLENKAGNVSVMKKCGPSYILKELTSPSDSRPDFVFFVEDIMAWRYLNSILRLYQQIEDRNIIVKIVYVGPYEQVICLAQSFYMVQPFSKHNVQSFLDADVKEVWDNLLAKSNLTDAEARKLALLNNNHNNITMLDITPELGIWTWLQNDACIFERDFVNQYGDLAVHISSIVKEVDDEEAGKSPGNPRNHAKGCFKNFEDKVNSILPAVSTDILHECLFRSYANYQLSQQDKFEHWKQIFKQIFNRK